MINGGFTTFKEILEHVGQPDSATSLQGVMVGRAVQRNTVFFQHADAIVFGEDGPIRNWEELDRPRSIEQRCDEAESRLQVVENYYDYVRGMQGLKHSDGRLSTILHPVLYATNGVGLCLRVPRQG